MSKFLKLLINKVRWLLTAALQVGSKIKNSSILRLSAKVIVWPIAKLNRCLREYEHWAVSLAAIGLFATLSGFMLELEDRQSERIFRVWEFVLRVTADPSKSSTNAQVATQGSSIREAMEYMNRDFGGLGCYELVSRIAFKLNGNKTRKCIFPKKTRETLENFSIPGVSLFEIKLPDAKLRRANLINTDLGNADLRRADLWRAILRESDLWRADLREADLRSADLRSADLRETNLRSAKLRRAEIERSRLSRADLRGAKGIICSQLKRARNWERAYRDKSLACGAPIPTSPR
ncbi:MAG: pentapeptide repeat-containing protein [Nitrospinae bacterium]|nr:pentapeptide repeat-containing protein [Nitrospinota bacterium]